MDIHKNARLTPHSRAELVRRVLDEGQTRAAVAAAFGVSQRTARNWIKRFQAEGPAGLTDRSSRPHRLRKPTPDSIVTQIEAPRRQRFTGKQIALETGGIDSDRQPGPPPPSLEPPTRSGASPAGASL